MGFLEPSAKNPTNKSLMVFIYCEVMIYVVSILLILAFLLQNSFRISFEYALRNLFLYYLYFGFLAFSFANFLDIDEYYLLFSVCFERQK